MAATTNYRNMPRFPEDMWSPVAFGGLHATRGTSGESPHQPFQSMEIRPGRCPGPWNIAMLSGTLLMGFQSASRMTQFDIISLSPHTPNTHTHSLTHPPPTSLSYSPAKSRGNIANQAHCHIAPRKLSSEGSCGICESAAPILGTTLLSCPSPRTSA